MNQKNNDICAIIITFNPVLSRVLELTKNLNQQGCDVIIVDNSATESMELDVSSAVYVALNKNIGIAEAQNVGITHCLDMNYQYVIFFDQDSHISDSFIYKLFQPMLENNYQICAPVFFDEKKGFEYAITDIKKNGKRVKHYSYDKTEPFTTSTVISSGTLVRSDVFKKVGMMDAGLFIDYVDTEWCLRCFENGIQVYVIPEAKMIHSIGDKSFRIFGFCVPVHSASRRYYRVRNSIHLFHYPHVPKLLALREVLFCVIHSVLLIIKQKNKVEYLFSFYEAIRDGFSNVKGENPRTLR